MMSIGTRDKEHFEYISFEPQLIKSPESVSLIERNEGNNSQESFEQFGGLELSFRSFSI